MLDCAFVLVPPGYERAYYIIGLLVVVLLLLYERVLRMQLLYERVSLSCGPKRETQQRNQMRAIAGDALRSILVGFPSSCCFRVGNCCAFFFFFCVVHIVPDGELCFVAFQCFLSLRSKMIRFLGNSWQYSAAFTALICSRIRCHYGHARSCRRASARRGESPLYSIQYWNAHLRLHQEAFSVAAPETLGEEA